MNETIIEGWTCSASPSGQIRAATNEIDGYRYCATCSRIGLMFSSADRGPAVPVPPAVLAWLIRPMLYQTWVNGCRKGNHGANAFDDNPHKDP